MENTLVEGDRKSSKIEEVNWKEILEYDETSPSCLRWKITIKTGRYGKTVKTFPGMQAGGKCIVKGQNRAWTLRFNKVKYYGHRIIWLMKHGNLAKNMVIDHIDGNPLNNNISNLRLVTQGTNCKNKSKKTTNTSGITGISMVENQKYWRATWGENGKTRSKGFSISRLGNELAYKLACDFRTEKLKLLGYTERHGL